ncbi:MAG: hypothetical protein V2J14_11805 [Erythrobacter sp.]|nr:hypothetical protein [Erythrobacter sp.]
MLCYFGRVRLRPAPRLDRQRKDAGEITDKVRDQTVFAFVWRQDDLVDESADDLGRLRAGFGGGEDIDQLAHLRAIAVRHVRVQQGRRLFHILEQFGELDASVLERVHLVADRRDGRAVGDRVDHLRQLLAYALMLAPVALEGGVALHAQLV